MVSISARSSARTVATSGSREASSFLRSMIRGIRCRELRRWSRTLNQGTENFTGYITNAVQSTGFTATSVSGTTLTTSASVTLPTGVMLFSNSLNYAGATIATGGTGTTFTITNPGSISFSGSAGSNAFLPELNVTALNPYTITGATYVPASGTVPAKVSFVVSAAPGFIEGSEFTISGITPSGYNRTYVADGSTTQSRTTIVGIPVTGPAGNPQPLSNPGAYSSGGTMVSVVMPGTRVLGIEQGNFILPYGSNGGTGTGGIGTYALNNLSGNTNTLTVTAVPPTSAAGTFNATTPSTQPVVVGTKFAQGSNTYTVTSVNGGGNFGVDTTTGLTTGTGNMTGVIGSAGSPVTLFAWPGHYYSAVAGTTTANPYGGVVTARTNGTLGDIFSTIGSNIFSVTSAAGRFGWWGALGNVSMLYGPFPQTSGGAPDTTKLASLCTKATDLNSFASANGLTVHSLYRLDDPGMFADSESGEIHRIDHRGKWQYGDAQCRFDPIRRHCSAAHVACNGYCGSEGGWMPERVPDDYKRFGRDLCPVIRGWGRGQSSLDLGLERRQLQARCAEHGELGRRWTLGEHPHREFDPRRVVHRGAGEWIYRPYRQRHDRRPRHCAHRDVADVRISCGGNRDDGRRCGWRFQSSACSEPINRNCRACRDVHG